MSSNPNVTTDWLCDMGQVTLPLWNSVCSPENGDNSPYLVALMRTAATCLLDALSGPGIELSPKWVPIHFIPDLSLRQ